MATKKKPARRKATKKKTPRKKAKGKQGPRPRREVSPIDLTTILEQRNDDGESRTPFGGPTAATKMTPKKRASFLAALAESGNVSEACKLAVVSRDCVYRLRKNDTDFAAAWEAAIEIACDVLEKEARRRAVDGWLEPVHHLGIPTSYVVKYSDTLLIFLLKGANPEKYRERYDVNSRGKANLEPTMVFYPSNGREVGEGDKDPGNGS
jgi:hypothetical protein